MDFGSLLHTAQRNGKIGQKEGVRCYSTKFEPPKKEQRSKDKLSENIKKFLAKKEAEERQKKKEVQRKKDELLALRAKDSKSTRRVNVMLKRTKSASQSVMQDACDTKDTSVTLAGPIQPDEDDYGYVSQEAAAFYNKMMEKYQKMPDDPKFPNSNSAKKKSIAELRSLEDPITLAKKRKLNGHPGSGGTTSHHGNDNKTPEHRGASSEDNRQAVSAEKPKIKKKLPPPPALNFHELLKLAEKKQFEPIVIEPKVKDEEKPLTKKQKKEMERVKEWRDRKEGKIPSNTINKPENKPIPKLKSSLESSNPKKTTDKSMPSTPSVPIKTKPPLNKTPVSSSRPAPIEPKSNNIAKCDINGKTSNSNSRTKENVSSNNRIKSESVIANSNNKISSTNKMNRPPLKPQPGDVKPSQTQKQPIKDTSGPRYLPPSKERERDPKRPFNPNNMIQKKKNRPQVVKGRIMDYDDDEDYDSEMDDFIDDGPEGGEDYSKYISEIFGYDKSKYKNRLEEEEDVDNMESSFAQQMREEVISSKIGIMEDLEDMKMEEEEKKRKALMLKKRKK